MTKRDAPRGGYRGGLPAAQVGPPAPLSSATIHPTEGLTDADLRADLVERLLGEIESWRRCRDALLGSLEEAEARAEAAERRADRLEGMAERLSERCVDIEDAQRKAEARAEAAEAKIARVRLALNAGAAVGQATPIPDVWRAVMRALADPTPEQTGGDA